MAIWRLKNEITSNLNHKLSELLPTIYNSPFTDFDGALVMRTEEAENRSKFSGYINKKNEFRSLLRKDTILFDDFSNKTWLELIFNFCLTKGPGILAYKKEIDIRYSHGSVPSASEIKNIFDKIPELIARESIDIELLNQVLNKNYIFYAEIRSLKN